MSPESRDLIVSTLRLEIEAFERDIRDNPRGVDAFGAAKADVRAQFLLRLNRALDEFLSRR